jgi:hypothetical protein
MPSLEWFAQRPPEASSRLISTASATHSAPAQKFEPKLLAGSHLESQTAVPTRRFGPSRPRDLGTKSETALFVLVGYGFAQNSTRTLWFDLCVRDLTAESLFVERHGARARNNFDVFELQRLAAC